MNLIKFLSKPAFVLLTSTLVGILVGRDVSDSKPNIIIIYADDVGYGDLGCYGGIGVDTPNLDRLATTGRRFTSAYATASTCTPSRYSLLTGEYPFRNQDAQILPGNAPLIIDPNKPTLASVMKNAGYATALVGKWHLGLGEASNPLDWNGLISPGPKELGFEYSFHMAATGDRVPSVYIENGRIVNLDPNDPVAVSYEEQIGDEPTGVSHPWLLKIQADLQHSGTIVDGISRIGWMTGGRNARWQDETMGDTFLGKALEFIDSNREKPFFLYYASQENHVPRVPHPRFAGSSSMGPRGDAVAQLDWNVGKILEKLDQLGLRADTIVIFSSDNGPVLFDGYCDGAVELTGKHDPSGPWYGGKYSSWEGGTRLPFIVSWPGRIEPSITDGLLSQVDVLASLLSIIGQKVPTGFCKDSQALEDLLLGKSDKGRESLIQQGVASKSIRCGDWKYIPHGVVRNRKGVGTYDLEEIPLSGALFYLPEDSEERNNLASIYPEVAAKLNRLLFTELGDSKAFIGDETGGANP